MDESGRVMSNIIRINGLREDSMATLMALDKFLKGLKGTKPAHNDDGAFSKEFVQNTIDQIDDFLYDKPSGAIIPNIRAVDQTIVFPGLPELIEDLTAVYPE